MADKAKVPVDELSTMIYVCWEASQVLETAFRSDPDGDPAIIEQTKIMAARFTSHRRSRRTDGQPHDNVNNRRIRCTAT